MPMLAQRRRQPLGHPDEPNASVLRRRQFATPIRVPHPNLPSFEIDVGPFERDDLTRSQPRLPTEEHDHVAAVVNLLRRDQQTLVGPEVVERRVRMRHPHQPN